MTLIKTYQAVDAFELGTNFITPNGTIWVNFTGGTKSPYKTNGTFSTGNKELQDIIEADTAFNKSFRLIHTHSDEPTEEENEVPTPPVTTPPAEDKVTTPPAENDPVIVREVTTVQEAREYLLALGDIKARDVSNRKLILDLAAKMKITFPNLPTA